MAIARSKITAQGQISVPAEVRKALGAEPGSFLEWEQEDGKVVVEGAPEESPLLDSLAAGADPRSGRWAGTGKTECGLHA